MDDDDSQNQMINRNASLGKGKRQAVFVLTDEDEPSDEEGEDSEEEETDSEEEDDEENGANADEDEAGDSDEPEDNEKELEGAIGGSSSGLGYVSSDEDADKCPICLNTFQDQAVGTPENCEHFFCLDCILEWSRNANSCPVDRLVYKNICLRSCYGGKIQRKIPIQTTAKTSEQEVDEQTNCEVCGRSDREDRLLLCDGCDAGYHMECLVPPLDAVPVEEWFCPECAVNNPSQAQEEDVNEDEVAVLMADVVPSTSRLRATTGQTRAIARTRQSERVRANVNRNRISQARNMQHVPRHLMESSLLEETIDAVVAGLNTAVYVRPLTPRAGTTRRRRTVKRRGTKSKKPRSKTAGGTRTKGTKRRRRRLKKQRSRRKVQLPKEPTARARIAKSLGMGKPIRGSSIPSVYRPVDPSLGAMRADIGAASLSVYGDPFDLDPFDDGNEATEQPSSPLSPFEVKRRGLSQSALKSHQPVARPVSIELRRALSIPEAEVITEAAPVPDLLGSILSGQSLLMMDSADVVINRDGSLKAIKPVISTQMRSVSSVCRVGGLATEVSATWSTCSKTSAFSSSGDNELPSSSSPCNIPEGSASFCLFASNGSLSPPVSPKPQVQLGSQSHNVRSATSGSSSIRLLTSAVPQPNPLASLTAPGGSLRNGNSGPCSLNYRGSNSDPCSRSTIVPARKVPLRPVRVDVSELPRIPKIKREDMGISQPRDGNSSGIPDSCMNNLTGNGGRQQTVGQRDVRSNQNRTDRSEGQRQSQGGSSSSSSYSCSSGSSETRPSSTVSFRISASGNSWHGRRLAHGGVFGTSLKPTGDEPWEIHSKGKQSLPAVQPEKREKAVKSEIYDPFDPTGSDSSSSESASDIFLNTSSETEKMSHSIQDSTSREQELPSSSWNFLEERKTGAGHQVKTERVHGDTDEKEDVEPNFEQRKESLCNKHSRLSGNGLKIACKSKILITEPLSDGEHGASAGGGIDTTHKTLELKKRLPQKDAHSRSNSPASTHSEKKIKLETKSEAKDHKSRSNSRSELYPHSSSDGKQSSKPEARLASDECCRSSSSETTKEKSAIVKYREKNPLRSRERRWSHSHSGSSSPEISERWARKKRRSRSRSKDRRQSCSSSSERAKKKNHKKERSCERYESKGSGSRQKDKKYRRSRSRSKERRKDRSRSRSTSRSKEARRSRSKERQRQRSRSREKKSETCGKMSQSIERKGERGSQKLGKISVETLKESKDLKEKPAFIAPVKDEPGVPKLVNESTPKGERKKIDECDLESKMDVVLEAKVKMEPTWPKEFGCSSCEDEFLGSVKDEVFSAQPISVDEHYKPKLVGTSENLPGAAFHETEPNKKENEEHSADKVNIDYILHTTDLIKHEVVEPIKVSAPAVDTVTAIKKDDATIKPEVVPSPVTATSKSRAPVKRVTWNLQDSDGPSAEKTGKVSLFKPQQSSKDGLCKAPESRQALNQVQLIEPPPTNYMIPQPMFPDIDPSQDFAEPAPLDTSVHVGSLPYAPVVSESTAQYIMQGNLATAGSATSLTCPSSSDLKAGVSEPGAQVPSAQKDEPRAPESVSDVDKSKNEKYIKKLHMQERAVEEVKLAIKPFYQKRDITKEEYKDILRKAVQKVCHSKSGEINPVKVANLVRAYVDKYKHARKHRKEAEGSRKDTAMTKDPPS
nr:PREDICTED: PHD and RING finger domain-containing protein 1 isoform X3 [Lepisosteus oculatus]